MTLQDKAWVTIGYIEECTKQVENKALSAEDAVKQIQHALQELDRFEKSSAHGQTRLVDCPATLG